MSTAIGWKPKTNGAVVHETDDIVVIVTGLRSPSSNDKTGPMAQAYIMPKDTHPVEAWSNGDDALVCFSCPFRKGGPLAARCYVNKGFGPAMAYKTYKRGGYEQATAEDVNAWLVSRNVGLRAGAWGDPHAAPYSLWATLTNGLRRWTGYTHQWQLPDFDVRMFGLFMASVDPVNTVDRLRELHGPTVRYYRVEVDGAPLAVDEIRCPSKGNDGKRSVTCAQCGLCNGGTRAKNIVIKEGS